MLVKEAPGGTNHEPGTVRALSGKLTRTKAPFTREALQHKEVLTSSTWGPLNPDKRLADQHSSGPLLHTGQ